MDQSKVMFIQKQKYQAKAKNHNPWMIGDKTVKECASYKYLGVTIKSIGSFSTHINTIREKLIKLIFPLKGKSGVVSVTSSYLFIRPYGSSYSKLCIKYMGFSRMV